MTPQFAFSRIALASLAIGCLVATAVPQQDAPSPQRRNSNTVQQDAKRPACNFITYSVLAGKAVTNRNGEEIGSISDVIVDRGSGQCKFYVLKSGDWAGLGGRLTAVPCDVFGWNAAKDQPTLDATPEQITMMPEFSSDRWEGLARPSSTWDELKRALAFESSNDRDSYATGDGSLEPISLKGNITQVERSGNAVTGEEIVIHVNADVNHFGEDNQRDADRNADRDSDRDMDRNGSYGDREARDADRDDRDVRAAGDEGVRIVLGPSWYVMSQPTAPMRGYTFEGEVVPLERADSRGDAMTYLAIKAEINGKPLQLRDEETNEPMWNLDERRAEGDRDARDRDDRARGSDRSMRAPFALLSDVDGAEVQCRGEDCGEVSDLVIDQPSGKVVFLVIDPDENFLGIADTNRLVPAGAASIGSDAVVRIDATKQMVLNSRELPEDINTLEQREALGSIYAAYELEEPRFEPLKKRDWNEVMSLGGWAGDSEFTKSVKGAEDVQVEGTVVRIERKEPTKTMSRATMIVLKTDKGNQNVLLGPTWYVDRQEIPFRVGDHVVITARNATLNGQPVMVACKVHGDDEREIVLWDNDTPAWDRR